MKPQLRTFFQKVQMNKSPTRIFKLNTDGTYANQNILLTNFDDPEAITHITGNYFAILEEADQGGGEFHITIVTITSATTSINKSTLDQNAPDESPPQSGIIKMTHADLNAGDGNQGPEGLAYDTNGASDGYFYIAKEKETEDGPGPVNDPFLFRVPDKGVTRIQRFSWSTSTRTAWVEPLSSPAEAPFCGPCRRPSMKA